MAALQLLDISGDNVAGFADADIQLVRGAGAVEQRLRRRQSFLGFFAVIGIDGFLADDMGRRCR